MAARKAQEWTIPVRPWRPGLGFPLLIFFAGLYWLLSDLGYIPRIPFWPLLVTLVGFFMVVSRLAQSHG